MKIQRHAWWLIPTISLSVFSCKEKQKEVRNGEDKESLVDKVTGVVEEALTPEAEPVLVKLSDEERAVKLGFARHLPKDTAVVVSAYNVKQAAKQLKALELYGLIEDGVKIAEGRIEGGVEEGAAEEPGIDIEVLEEDDFIAPDAEQVEEDEVADAMEDPVGPWALLGQEVTLAFGKTTTEQAGNLMTFNRRYAYNQAVALGKAALVFAEEGSVDAFLESMDSTFAGTEMIDALINDGEAGLDLLKKLDMPTLYMAFRAKEGNVDEAAQMITSSMGMFALAGNMVAPIEIEQAGSTFSGYQILGEKVADTMETQRESMEEGLSPEIVTELLDIVRSRKLTVVTGNVGDYVVVMIGGAEDELVLSSDVKDSLVSSGELDFVDSYAESQLVSLIYGEEGLIKTLVTEAGGLATYALGLRDGILGGGALGDTRDLQALLQIVADREKSLLSLGAYDDLGLIAFVDDGLRIESFGGYDKGSVDWAKPTTLSHLGDSGDNFLFLNVPGDAEYDEKLGEYAEALFETAYAVTLKLSELGIEEGSFAAVGQYAQLFDGQFREDVVGIYEAISGDLADGLGNETALVIDLNGTVPSVPGVPKSVVNEAKAPRFTMVSPVDEREKLGSAWTQIDAKAASLLAKVGGMFGQDIPMLKPVSSDKDGMTTWFFPLPFFQDDFMPSVTVTDEWFAASTSKTRAVDLIGKAKAGGKAGNGIKFYLNFNALTSYADETLKILEKNAEDIFPNELKMEEFMDNKEKAKALIEASKDFDSLDWNVRKEGDLVRSSIHFKMK